MEIYYGNIFPRIVGILSYILCSEFIHHFCEIFNVIIVAPNATEGSFLLVDGEIHATCLASNLLCNS